MKSTPPNQSATTQPAGEEPVQRTFKQMIEAGNFTSRTLQDKLLMAWRTVKKAEENPSVLSLGDVFRLAHLMQEDFQVVLAELVHEIQQLPQDKHPLNQGKQTR